MKLFTKNYRKHVLIKQQKFSHKFHAKKLLPGDFRRSTTGGGEVRLGLLSACFVGEKEFSINRLFGADPSETFVGFCHFGLNKRKTVKFLLSNHKSISKFKNHNCVKIQRKFLTLRSAKNFF